MASTAFARRAILAAATLSAHAAHAQGAPPGIAAALAPGGTLRVAINFGNPVLAQRDPAGGAPRGVSAVLATEIGRRLGLPIQWVPFQSAGSVTDAVGAGAWDLCFLAIDPVRAHGASSSPRPMW